MTKKNKIAALRKEIRDLERKIKELEPVVTEFYRLQNKAEDLYKKRNRLVYGEEIYEVMY